MGNLNSKPLYERRSTFFEVAETRGTDTDDDISPQPHVNYV
jgi:hypothetical protein